MPKVIFEQLQYPALSPTLMYVQLADTTIRYPEGTVENLQVRVKNSFVLTNFVVLDMEDDLRVHPWTTISKGRQGEDKCRDRRNPFTYRG
jgi:hypothetical protein